MFDPPLLDEVWAYNYPLYGQPVATPASIGQPSYLTNQLPAAAPFDNNGSIFHDQLIQGPSSISANYFSPPMALTAQHSSPFCYQPSATSAHYVGPIHNSSPPAPTLAFSGNVADQTELGAQYEILDLSASTRRHGPDSSTSSGNLGLDLSTVTLQNEKVFTSANEGSSTPCAQYQDEHEVSSSTAFLPFSYMNFGNPQEQEQEPNYPVVARKMIGRNGGVYATKSPVKHNPDNTQFYNCSENQLLQLEMTNDLNMTLESTKISNHSSSNSRRQPLMHICELCGREFARYKNLKRHEFNVHGIQERISDEIVPFVAPAPLKKLTGKAAKAKSASKIKTGRNRQRQPKKKQSSPIKLPRRRRRGRRTDYSYLTRPDYQPRIILERIEMSSSSSSSSVTSQLTSVKKLEILRKQGKLRTAAAASSYTTEQRRRRNEFTQNYIKNLPRVECGLCGRNLKNKYVLVQHRRMVHRQEASTSRCSSSMSGMSSSSRSISTSTNSSSAILIGLKRSPSIILQRAGAGSSEEEESLGTNNYPSPSTPCPCPSSAAPVSDPELEISAGFEMKNVTPYPPPYECNICHARLKRKEIRHHLTTIHQTYSFRLNRYCTLTATNPPSTTTTSNNLLGRRGHGQYQRSRRHECNICHTSFTRGYSLRQHQVQVHKEPIRHGCQSLGKKFECKFCDRNFTRRRSLLQHQTRSHQPPPPAAAAAAASSATTTTAVGYEEGEIQSNQSYQCNLCSAIVSRTENFERHLASVHKLSHGVKNGPDTVQYGTLLTSNHVVGLDSSSSTSRMTTYVEAESEDNENGKKKPVVQGNKNYECNICHRNFRLNYVLHRHQVLIHGKQAPAEISQKRWRRQRQSQSRQQQRRKTGSNQQDSKHECNICHANFTTNYSLRRHLVMEHKLRLPGYQSIIRYANSFYQCNLCHVALYYQSIRKHLESVHQIYRRKISKQFCTYVVPKDSDWTTTGESGSTNDELEVPSSSKKKGKQWDNLLSASSAASTSTKASSSEIRLKPKCRKRKRQSIRQRSMQTQMLRRKRTSRNSSSNFCSKRKESLRNATRHAVPTKVPTPTPTPTRTPPIMGKRIKVGLVQESKETKLAIHKEHLDILQNQYCTVPLTNNKVKLVISSSPSPTPPELVVKKKVVVPPKSAPPGSSGSRKKLKQGEWLQRRLRAGKLILKVYAKLLTEQCQVKLFDIGFMVDSARATGDEQPTFIIKSQDQEEIAEAEAEAAAESPSEEENGSKGMEDEEGEEEEEEEDRDQQDLKDQEPKPMEKKEEQIVIHPDTVEVVELVEIENQEKVVVAVADLHEEVDEQIEIKVVEEAQPLPLQSPLTMSISGDHGKDNFMEKENGSVSISINNENMVALPSILASSSSSISTPDDNSNSTAQVLSNGENDTEEPVAVAASLLPIIIEEDDFSVEDLDRKSKDEPKHIKTKPSNLRIKVQDDAMRLVKCEICKSEVPIIELSLHKVEHEIQCHICLKHVRLNEIRNHGISHIVSNICEICSLPFESRETLWEHSNIHFEVKPIICTYCGIGYVSHKDLAYHCFAKHANLQQTSSLETI